jgi:hypothetical protein
MVQAARVGRAWPWFRATMGYRQPTPEQKLAGCRGVDPRTARFGGSPVRWNPTHNWRRALLPPQMPVRTRRGFQPVPRLARFTLQNGGRRSVLIHSAEAPAGFRSRAALPSSSPSNVADSGRARSTNPLGFHPASNRRRAPARFTVQCGGEL